ncbi:MAG TPA: tRNA preQ1(34) S-adenosylmethionine ribosyltransferase-isomerase QueA [Gemmatimonadales bacterium]|nr:tRNA preQ1(34) S-adenosylmethionine ribosyltransferase-isomerase QueA [Gemmatimonadales bacterium]
MTPEPLRTSDFDYELPPELIAQEPLAERAASKLLVLLRNDRRQGPADRRQIPRAGVLPRRISLMGERIPIGASAVVDSSFTELPSLIAPGDLLVLNTTKVRHARLLGRRKSGAPAEVLLIHPGTEGTWIAMGKPGAALRPGKQIELGPDALVETVSVLENGNRLVRFIGLTAEDAIKRYGQLPLPPYIARSPRELDETRYQTVYARQEGSVAAPTAGLHFTPRLLDDLSSAGVVIAGLDLEIGPGTFKPVETEDPAQHSMHPERYEITPRLAALVERVREDSGRVWAVGTTVVRALESAAREDGTLMAGRHDTRLMITPGYTFRVVDRLLTNFHLPRSTLLMLVAAFAGRELTFGAYRHAISQRYRFYSYGDAMVIL